MTGLRRLEPLPVTWLALMICLACMLTVTACSTPSDRESDPANLVLETKDAVERLHVFDASGNRTALISDRDLLDKLVGVVDGSQSIPKGEMANVYRNLEIEFSDGSRQMFSFYDDGGVKFADNQTGKTYESNREGLQSMWELIRAAEADTDTAMNPDSNPNTNPDSKSVVDPSSPLPKTADVASISLYRSGSPDEPADMTFTKQQDIAFIMQALNSAVPLPEDAIFTMQYHFLMRIHSRTGDFLDLNFNKGGGTVFEYPQSGATLMIATDYAQQFKKLTSF